MWFKLIWPGAEWGRRRLVPPPPDKYANPRLGEATQGRRQKDKGPQGAAGLPSSESHTVEAGLPEGGGRNIAATSLQGPISVSPIYRAAHS